MKIPLWLSILLGIAHECFTTERTHQRIAAAMPDHALMEKVNFDAADGRIVTAYSSEYDKRRACLNAS